MRELIWDLLIEFIKAITMRYHANQRRYAGKCIMRSKNMFWENV